MSIAQTEASSEQTQKIRAALAADPGRMTMQLAKELGVAEAEIVRAMPAERVTELDPARWEELFRAFEPLGTVHVIVSNGAVTLEAVGQFGNFSTWNEFFNVQTDSLDMHIRWPELGSIFAVQKPSHMSGVSTLSFQIFDRSGHAAMKVFLNFGGKASPAMAEAFTRFQEQFRKM